MKINSDEFMTTSDLHFYHTNILTYSNRPWDNVEEMNEGIINNWNSVVTNKHKVFIIGDVAMGGARRAPELAVILSRLNGTKFLIPGNHDTYILESQECLKNITVLPPLIEVSVNEVSQVKGKKQTQRIVMCHYAMKVWNRSHHGTWMLYGHSHHTMPTDYSIKSFDVGIDGPGYNYTPLSYNQVKEIMSTHDQEVVDHHSSNTNDSY